MNLPAAGPAREPHFDGARTFAAKALLEAEFPGGALEEPVGGLIEQALAGAIHQAQAGARIEGEDGDVNLLHDFAEQGRGFERSQPLLAQRGLQGVGFAKDFAKRVIGPRTASADGEVTLAQGGEKVRKRAQGEDDAVGGGERKRQPQPGHHQRDGPVGPGAEVARPQKQQSNERAGQAREKRGQEDPPFVRQRSHKPNFLMRR